MIMSDIFTGEGGCGRGEGVIFSIFRAFYINMLMPNMLNTDQLGVLLLTWRTLLLKNNSASPLNVS